MIEVQATAERTPFDRASLDQLLSLAAAGIEEISALETRVLHEARTGVANPHKAHEFERLLPGFEVSPAGELPEETGATFATTPG